MKLIPVVWGLDRNYVLQAFVVMHSILRNSKGYFEFILLSADDMGTDIELYKTELEKNYDNFSVRFVEINSAYFGNADILNEHLTAAAYNRLLIAEYVKDYDKCIYLDCDVLVYGDINELFEFDISEYYVMGVKDCHIIEDTLAQVKHQEDIGLKDKYTYINSGVLVMNLKKIREDMLIRSFLVQSRKYNKFEDQDIINVCCYGKIGILPLKYNLFHFYQGDSIKLLFRLPYEEKDFDFKWNRPFILHMGSIYKPWYNYKVKGSNDWWNLAELFKGSSWYDYYKGICHRCNDENIGTLVEKCKSYRSVIIWGYTQNGKNIFEILRAGGVGNIVAFVDNDVRLLTGKYKGISVVGLEQVREKFTDIFWIVSCQKAYAEIMKQLLENGIEESDIIRYSENAKGSFYYLALEERYYEEELDDIVAREWVGRIADREERKKYIEDLLNNPEMCQEDYVHLYRKFHLEQWLLLKRRR